MRIEWIRFGDIMRLERYRLNPDPAVEYRQIGIYSWGKGVIESDPVRGSELSKVSYYSIPSGALIFSNIQAWEAAIAVSEDRHRDQFIASQRFLPYVPVDPGRVCTRYLCNFLLSEPGMALIRRASPGSIARNRTLGMKAIEDVPVPVPSRSGQNQIVNEIAQAERAAKAVLARSSLALAVKRLIDRRFEELESCEFAVPASEILESYRPWISIADAVAYRPIGVRSFGRGLIRYEEVFGGDLSKLRYYVLDSDLIVVSNIKAWEGAVALTTSRDIGRVASNRFLSFRVAGSNLKRSYVHRYLTSQAGVAKLARASPGSADRNRTLSSRALLETPIPMPSRAVQDEIVAMGMKVDEMQSIEQRQRVVANALPVAARNSAVRRLLDDTLPFNT